MSSEVEDKPELPERMDLFYFIAKQQIHLLKCDSCRKAFQQIFKHMEETDLDFKRKVESHRKLLEEELSKCQKNLKTLS